jgi:hypothetical protein
LIRYHQLSGDFAARNSYHITAGTMAEQVQSELFQEWRRECELIDREMAQIAGASLSLSEDERQVRKFQFASLIERRSTAARKFLSSRGVMRRVRPSE